MKHDSLKLRIKKNEGFSIKPYKDQLGNHTIGYGHLIKKNEKKFFKKKFNKKFFENLFEKDFLKALDDYKNKFKANFIETAATEVRANESKTNQVKVIIAAKEVDVVDGYAEKLNINKFDLAIDWGFLYFLTKPIFLISDYFFKLT